MDIDHHFSAPWGKALSALTLLGVTVLIGGMIGLSKDDGLDPSLRLSMMIGFGTLLLACAACRVKGYRLENDSLIVQRWGWERRPR